MIRAIALITFGAIVVVTAGCGDSPDAPDETVVEAASEGKPIAEFSEKIINIGEVVMDSDEDHRRVQFTVKNTGTAPLKIAQVTKSCQCSMAEARKTTLEPGESTTIDVDVKIKLAGDKYVRLNVNSNCSVKPHKALEVKWFAIPPYEVDVKEIDFGEVMPETKYEWKVQYTPNENGACAETRPSFNQEFKSERLSASVEDDGTIKVTLQTGSEPGKAAEELEFKVDGCWKDKINIPVRWDTQPPVSVQPNFVFMKVKPGEEFRKEITLNCVSQAELLVDPVDNDDVKIEWERIDKSRQKGTLRVKAPMKPGRFSKRIQIAIKQPTSKPVVISVAGAVSEK